VNRAYFLTDLDGTLLRPDGRVSVLSQEILTRVLNEGHVISFATARSYTSSMKAVSSVPWKYPIVLYNGALLYDPVNRSILDGRFLEAELSLGIIETGRAYGLAPLWFALDGADREIVLHEPPAREGDLQFLTSRKGDPRFQEQPQLSGTPGIQTLELTYIALEEELAPLRDAVMERFGDRVHVHLIPDGYIRDHYFLEFSHPWANKREGLKLWARHVGASPDQITVYGDNLNDIGLFEAAGTRVAVANAHVTLRDMADRIVGSNAEDGVAEDIRRQLFSLCRTAAQE
jgi:5-amino-6-(5-phospho-D-ribitylamino)uracil phosphatase